MIVFSKEKTISYFNFFIFKREIITLQKIIERIAKYFHYFNQWRRPEIKKMNFKW